MVSPEFFIQSYEGVQLVSSRLHFINILPAMLWDFLSFLVCCHVIQAGDVLHILPHNVRKRNASPDGRFLRARVQVTG